MARKTAERRLQEAEQRLIRLEHGIKQQGGGEEEEEARREEMIGDVKAIKRKFHFVADGCIFKVRVVITEGRNVCKQMY